MKQFLLIKEPIMCLFIDFDNPKNIRKTKDTVVFVLPELITREFLVDFIEKNKDVISMEVLINSIINCFINYDEESLENFHLSNEQLDVLLRRYNKVGSLFQYKTIFFKLFEEMLRQWILENRIINLSSKQKLICGISSIDGKIDIHSIELYPLTNSLSFFQHFRKIISLELPLNKNDIAILKFLSSPVLFKHIIDVLCFFFEKPFSMFDKRNIDFVNDIYSKELFDRYLQKINEYFYRNIVFIPSGYKFLNFEDMKKEISLFGLSKEDIEYEKWKEKKMAETKKRRRQLL